MITSAWQNAAIRPHRPHRRKTGPLVLFQPFLDLLQKEEKNVRLKIELLETCFSARVKQREFCREINKLYFETNNESEWCIKGNSIKGERSGSKRTNTAQVELGGHFYVCKEEKSCNSDAVEDTFTRQWEPNLPDLPSSCICSSRHLLELQLCQTWRREAISPSSPSGWKEATARNSHITSSKLAAAASEQWECACAAGQVGVQIVSEIWRAEGACLDLPTWMSHCGERGYLDGAAMDCSSRRSQSTWWHFLPLLQNKDRITAGLLWDATWLRRRQRGLRATCETQTQGFVCTWDYKYDLVDVETLL